MPRISVDGRFYDVEEGRTILQAMDDLGLLMDEVDIPHYCWHPKLSIDGSCRLCQVEVEGLPKLQIACDTQVKDGMEIRTSNDRVQKAREGVMELLLVNHPLDCPICDQAGECKLQDYAFEYGLDHARTQEPRRALKKKYDLGSTVLLDQERCILCRRCVRFCREVPKTGELGVFARGDRSTIDLFPGAELDNDYSMNVADICPVGALTTKDFRFKIRVWFLDDIPGVCAGCAAGCNIHLGAANNKVYRYLPRRNDAVNETWICDGGRMSYKAIGASDRLTEVQIRGDDGRLAPATRDQGLTEAARRLKVALDTRGPGGIAALASPHATNEDLFVLRRLLDAMGVDLRAVAIPLGEADDLLIQAEKAANGAGARALGYGAPDTLVERVRNGGIEALLVLGHDVLDARYLADETGLAGIETVILLDTHHSALERVAHIVFPARHAAEKLGTLTNHAGRVQKVEPAVEPGHEAYAEGEVLTRLGAALGLAEFDAAWDPRAVSAAMGSEVPSFAGVDLDSVGHEGRVLSRGEAR